MLKQLLRINIIVLAIANSANVINYTIQIILGRSLTPASYGIFNAVNSLGVILASLTQVIPIVISNFVVQNTSNRPKLNGILKFSYKFVLSIGLVSCLPLLICSPLLASYLNLPDIYPVIIFTIGIFFLYTMALGHGIASGLSLYIQQSSAMFENAILRLVAIIGLIWWLRLDYNAAISIAVAANLFTTFRLVGINNKRLKILDPQNSGSTKISSTEKRQILWFTLPTLLTWIFFNFITNVDLVLVKHFSSSHDTGIYAVASIIGRIALFLPQMLPNILFPEIIKKQSENKASFSIVLMTLILTLLSSGGIVVIVKTFSSEIIRTLFGAQYMQASLYLPTITAAMGVCALLNVLNTTFLAQKKFFFIIPCYLISTLMIMGIYLTSDTTPLDVANGILLGSLTIFLFGLSILVWPYFKGLCSANRNMLGN